MRKPCSSSSPSSGAFGAEAAAPSSGKKTACCTKVGLKRGPWTPEEDELLSGYIKKEGEGRWRTLPKRAGLLRCGKSCRLRWMNYLRPDVKRGQIAPDEEDLILRLHRLLGNRWSLIAGRIPGRTDNEIKNYWNTHLSKKLISQGIDPRTHKPLDPGGAAHQVKLAPSSSKPNGKSNPGPRPSAINPSDNSSSDEGINLQIGNPSLNLDYGSQEYGTLGGVGLMRGEEEDDDINYCTDDVFSSFLNSLINEDSYQQHAANTLIAPPCGDPAGFGTGAVAWESALALINHKDPNKLLHDNNATAHQ